MIFEAARSICSMRDVTARELTPAVTVLQLFLSSSKPVLRFAAVRTLNKARRAARRAQSRQPATLGAAPPSAADPAAVDPAQVAMSHPVAVTNCNIDMESLIADPNRSIATLAITTLLKTGSESSIDRLLKQIGGFMGEIADEFKVVVVEAIKALALKFPQVGWLCWKGRAGLGREGKQGGGQAGRGSSFGPRAGRG